MRISDWSSDVCSSDLLLAENEENSYVAYVSQQNLEHDDSDVPVHHPAIDQLFNAFEQGRYVLKREHKHLRRHGLRRRGRTGPAQGLCVNRQFHKGGKSETRSEERRVGKEWVSTCRSRWSRET